MRRNDRKLDPDYGWHMKRSGVGSDDLFFLPDFRVDHIAVVSHTAFCASANIKEGGRPFCVTLDLTRDQVERIAMIAPPENRRLIEASVLNSPSFPTVLHMQTPFNIQIEARLGRPQQSGNDSFIPFVVANVAESLLPKPLDVLLGDLYEEDEDEV